MFWQRFYDLCFDAGTKPNPVGKKVGISSATITQWKQGAVPAGDNLSKIADELDCSVDYLLDRTENPQSHKSQSLTTGDINGDYNNVIGHGNSDISITVSASGQAAALLEAFEKLDPFKQAKVLVYVEELEKSI